MGYSIIKGRAPSRIVERAWGTAEHGDGLFHCREVVNAEDDRIAWAFAVERSGVVEIEELFVKPAYRRQGYGSKLFRSVSELARDHKCRLKGWVSYADVDSGKLPAVRRFFSKLGLVLSSGSVRWAPYVVTNQADSREAMGSSQPSRLPTPVSPYLR